MRTFSIPMADRADRYLSKYRLLLRFTDDSATFIRDLRSSLHRSHSHSFSFDDLSPTFTTCILLSRILRFATFYQIECINISRPSFVFVPHPSLPHGFFHFLFISLSYHIGFLNICILKFDVDCTLNLICKFSHSFSQTNPP